MRTVVAMVGCLMVAACSADAIPVSERDRAAFARQCEPMAGPYAMTLYEITGPRSGCPVSYQDAWLAFIPGDVSTMMYDFSPDGCHVTASVESDRGGVYTYDLLVEPDGLLAHGRGTFVASQFCNVKFKVQAGSR